MEVGFGLACSYPNWGLACSYSKIVGLFLPKLGFGCLVSAERDSWNDLTTAGTPEFLNSKAREIFVDDPPIHSKLFFYICRTCGGVSTPYRINLFAREICAPAQDG
jgi:hypothetical protein